MLTVKFSDDCIVLMKSFIRIPEPGADMVVERFLQQVRIRLSQLSNHTDV